MYWMVQDLCLQNTTIQYQGDGIYTNVATKQYLGDTSQQTLDIDPALGWCLACFR